jgi:hypothetical protein
MTLRKFLLIVALHVMVVQVLGQGTFQNLNFESATIVPDPSSPYYPYAVFASSAIPGWVAYIGGSQQTDIIHNTVSLGAAAISIHDTTSSFQPIQGNYSVLLQPSSGGPPTTAAIGQIGQIPSTAVSLIFYGTTTMQVTFDGQSLSLIQLGSAPGYQIVGADISAFAGQTGELRFLMMTNPQFGLMSYLDNIQFSTSPIPEPSTIGLFTLGGLFLRWRFTRRQ